MEPRIQELKLALLKLDRKKIKEIFEADSNSKSVDVIEAILVPAMDEIGTMWADGSLSLSQVYMCGKLVEDSVSVLPSEDRGNHKYPKIAITVFQDYHFLGKRIVFSILKSSGYSIMDYGQMSDPYKIIDKIINDDIELLLVSTLMLNSALHVKELIELLKKEKPNVKVVVGGAPFRFDNELWMQIGADGMGCTATDIFPLLNTLFPSGRPV